MKTLPIYLIFFVSGFSALVFEILWFHQAGLVFGNSVWATSIVLASFMGGLACGNAISARYAENLKRPLWVYAWLEIIIGLTGLLLVLGLPHLTTFLAPLFNILWHQTIVLNLAKLCLVFLLLLVPTTAMGMTLPILVKELCAQDTNFGNVLGRLYGWNTLGAVFGVLGAEFVLIENLGIQHSGMLAAGLNFSAAAIAWILFRRKSSMSPVAKIATTQKRKMSANLILMAAFLSGGIFLACEVIWTRFIMLFVIGTSTALTIVLAVILSGISLGGFITAWWLRKAPTKFRLAPYVALASGIMIIIGFEYLESVIQIAIDSPADPYSVILLTLNMLFPVAILSGALFAFLGITLKSEIENSAEAAGLITFANTTGAMLGAILGGFVFLPFLGIENSLFVLAGAYGLIVYLLIKSQGSEKSASKVVPLLLLSLIFLVKMAFFPFGTLQNKYVRQALSGYHKIGEYPVAYREGTTETIIYLRRDIYKQPYYFRMITNSQPMSNTLISAKRYMKLYVYLPVALHPNIKSALLISYGVGSTAKALTDTQSIKQIDVVDISKNVLDLSSIVYPDRDQNPLTDTKRVKVHIEDGRHFLQTTHNRYDLITAEPPPPKMAKINNLYSQEYFQLIYDRLTEGGMTTYWLPVHNLYPADSKAIIRAFCNVFSDCSLWVGHERDWMLFGTRNASGGVSEEQFSRQWKDPVVGPELFKLGIESPEQLGSLFMADSSDLKKITASTLPLNDNYPQRLSPTIKMSSSPSKRFLDDLHTLNVLWLDVNSARKRFEQSAFVARFWPQELVGDSLGYFTFQGILNDHFISKANPDHGMTVFRLHQVLMNTSLRTLPLWLLDSDYDQHRILSEILKKRDPFAEDHYQLGLKFLVDQNFAQAAYHFEQNTVLQLENIRPLRPYLHLYSVARVGDKDEVAKLIKQARQNPGAISQKFLDWILALVSSLP